MWCWYCHWGWPKQVAEIYDHAVAALEGDAAALHYGPAHSVWEDENFTRGDVQWCLDHFDDYRREQEGSNEGAVVRRSLEQLLALPDAVLCAQPVDYDGEDDPMNYPPAADLEMARR